MKSSPDKAAPGRRTKPLLTLTFLALALALALQAAAGAEFAPLPDRATKAPIAYARIPLPWRTSGALNPVQQERLVTGLCGAMGLPGMLSHAVPRLLSLTDSPIEIVVLPPGEGLGVPDVAARGFHHGDREEIAGLLKSIFLSVLAMQTRQDASGLQFQRVKTDKTVQDTMTLLLLSFRITVDDSSYAFICSGRRDFPNFAPVTAGEKPAKWAQKESGWGTRPDDLVLYADIAEILRAYAAVLAKAYPLMRLPEKISALSLDQCRSLAVYSSGSGESFSLRAELQWNPGKHLWSSLKPGTAKTAYPAQKDASFRGGLVAPRLDEKHLEALLGLVSPEEKAKAPVYRRIQDQLGESCSFSWHPKAAAPIFFMQVKDGAAFDRELENLLATRARFAREKSGDRQFTHVLWKGSSLSYLVEKDLIVFSPLIHALRDMPRDRGSFQQGELLLSMEYPFEGSREQMYYSLVVAACQAVVSTRGVVDPAMFPAFSSLQASGGAWKGTAGLRVSADANGLRAVWNHPYGLPGLLSSLNLRSSDYISFLSLLSLTWSSL